MNDITLFLHDIDNMPSTDQRSYYMVPKSSSLSRSPVSDVRFKNKVYQLQIERLRRRRLPAIAKERNPRGHKHPVYHIVLYTAGEATVFHRSRQVVCRAGTLLLVEPGDQHAFAVHGAMQQEFTALTFHYEAMDHTRLTLPMHELLAHFSGWPVELPEAPIQLSGDQMKFLKKAMDSLMDQLFVVDEHWSFTVGTSFLNLLCTMVRTLTADVSAEQSRALDNRIAKVRNEIAERRCECLCLDDLARLAGMSKGHLIRAFKKAVGTTPIDYQLRLRIESAQQILMTTDYRIEEIAHEVGFDNPFYFTRVFKRIVGIPPTTFRAQLADHA